MKLKAIIGIASAVTAVTVGTSVVATTVYADTTNNDNTTETPENTEVELTMSECVTKIRELTKEANSIYFTNRDLFIKLCKVVKEDNIKKQQEELENKIAEIENSNLSDEMKEYLISLVEKDSRVKRQANEEDNKEEINDDSIELASYILYSEEGNESEVIEDVTSDELKELLAIINNSSLEDADKESLVSVVTKLYEINEELETLYEKLDEYIDEIYNKIDDLEDQIEAIVNSHQDLWQKINLHWYRSLEDAVNKSELTDEEKETLLTDLENIYKLEDEIEKLYNEYEEAFKYNYSDSSEREDKEVPNEESLSSNNNEYYDGININGKNFTSHSPEEVYEFGGGNKFHR